VKDLTLWDVNMFRIVWRWRHHILVEHKIISAYTASYTSNTFFSPFNHATFQWISAPSPPLQLFLVRNT